MLFTGPKNIDPSWIYRIFKIEKIHTITMRAARFTRDYLKTLNFDTQNLSPTGF